MRALGASPAGDLNRRAARRPRLGRGRGDRGGRGGGRALAARAPGTLQARLPPSRRERRLDRPRLRRARPRGRARCDRAVHRLSTRPAPRAATCALEGRPALASLHCCSQAGMGAPATTGLRFAVRAGIRIRRGSGAFRDSRGGDRGGGPRRHRYLRCEPRLPRIAASPLRVELGLHARVEQRYPPAAGNAQMLEHDRYVAEWAGIYTPTLQIDGQAVPVIAERPARPYSRPCSRVRGFWARARSSSARSRWRSSTSTSAAPSS